MQINEIYQTLKVLFSNF